MLVEGPRTALVIGNAEYRVGPLKNPVNDARAMQQTLERVGFDVIVVKNGNQKQMKRAIDEFGRKIRNGGVGLFYFSGHGMQVQGINYLIPVGAEIEFEEDVERESVSADRVLSSMNAAGNSMNLVILDACRNNPYTTRRFRTYARSLRSASQGLATLDAPSGTFIAYATAPGKVASDGNGRNGLYTGELIKHMRTPGLKIEDVFKKTSAGVQSIFKDQVPWISSSFTGDFYFVPGEPGSDNNNKEKPFAVEEEIYFSLKSTAGLINYFEYHFSKKIGLGFLQEKITNNPSQTIKESTNTFGIFSNYYFNCFKCDTKLFFLFFGSGNLMFEKTNGNSYIYKVNYAVPAFGYQWFWNNKISFLLLGGVRFRNFVKNTNRPNEQYISNNSKDDSTFYPLFFLGYTF